MHDSTHPINGWLHKSAIHALLIADILFSSRLYWMVDSPLAQPLLLGLCAGMSALYFIFALARGYLLASALLASGVALIVGQMHVFSALTGVAVNYNAGFQYGWLSTFIVFYLTVRDGHGIYLARRLLDYGTVYAASYILLVICFAGGLIDASNLGPLIAEDVERGQRIFTYAIASVCAWFGWLHRLRSERTFLNISMAAMCALAVGLALSRYVTVLALMLTLATLAGWRLRQIGVLSVIAFVAACAYSLYGVFDTNWNPFDLFAHDTSGAFRIWEYDLARAFLRDHAVFGVGIPPTTADAWSFAKQEYFSPSDLGPIGVWFDLGLLGLIAFATGACIASSPRIDLPLELKNPLVLTGCVLTVYGGLAPVLLYPGGATHFAVLLAYWLEARGRVVLPTDTQKTEHDGHGHSHALSSAGGRTR